MKTPQHKLESYKKAQEKWLKKTNYRELYYQKNKEKIKERAKKWQKENKERVNELARKNRKKGQSISNKNWHKNNPGYNKKNRDKVKLEVLTHYSKEVPKCNICGFADIDCLAIDHINNDGAQHRKINRTGYKIYCWLKKTNYPKDFQVLCCNCNWKKHKTIIKNKIAKY